jgi:hypothetical protein
MSYRKLVAAGVVCLAFNVAACSAGRDVEVSGKVTAASSVTVGDKLVVEFVDVVGEGEEQEKTVVHTTELEALGDFKETVSLEGDRVIVRAIDDRNRDGKCTAGEAWGEAEAAIAEDEVEPVTLALSTAACPAG